MTFFNRKFLGVYVKPTELATTTVNGKIIETKSGIWSVQDIYNAKKVDSWDYNFINNSVPGLAWSFFSGNFRSVIGSGNIGTIPLGTTQVRTSISYGTRGDYYGFIAIGYFRPPTTGNYTIYTSSDDGSGVWIGDLALPGATRTASNATLNNGMGLGQGDTKRSKTISLVGGVWYPIRIVHEEGEGGDNLTFSWSGPGISETTNLANHFRTEAINGVSTGKYVNFKF